MTKKFCKKCGHEKNLEEFYKDSSKKDGYRPDCKICRKKYLRLYYQKNKKKKLLQVAKYRIQNKLKIKNRMKKYNETDKGKATIARGHHNRRSREKNTLSLLTHNEWSMVLSLQEYKCACCKNFFDDTTPEKDHIIPISKGGNLIINNVQALCRQCNNTKNDKIIDFRSINHINILKEMDLKITA